MPGRTSQENTSYQRSIGWVRARGGGHLVVVLGGKGCIGLMWERSREVGSGSGGGRDGHGKVRSLE
jgi:hypothetical protein